ncbi:DNA polymerase III subunit beta [Blattabacterium cuenoti]|uniref:Beta sliding clamp n=1 Tax=Blattabacterium cuenoti BPAY TaxID=1457031 RepID=A0ABM7EZ80_9FLAO|nr:DNA polymerase III subunit beta [Blattabacterium cuenoti]BAR92307.1 DNA polymerase III subunit beta [Blattabacterium cuenoti BPAY]
MYFSVLSYFLLRKLHTLYKIININNLSNSITFEISKKNQLKIIWGLDSKNIIYTYIKINVQKYTKEKVTLSIKFMINVLTTFSNEELFLKNKKNTLNIYSKQGVYKIPTYYDYSNHNKNIFILCKSSFVRRISLFSKLFLRILNKTLFFTTRDEELNPILNGVFFQFFTHEANFVATDTYKLIKYTIKNFKTDQRIQFTISRKYLNIVREILKNEKRNNIIIEYYEKKNIIFYFRDHIFSCQLMNENYPDYRSVIPHNKCHISLIINKFLLLNTIKRVSIFSKNRKNFIDFHFNHNKLKIYDQNTIDDHNSTSEIQCQVLSKNLKNMKIGFNSKFLIEILSSLNEDFVYFELYHNKMGVLRPLYKKKKEESILILIMSIIKV